MARFRISVSISVIAALVWVPLATAAEDKDKQPAGQRQEYSEKDKKTMAEIAQRPEVQKMIETAWGTEQRKDMMEAFETNKSGEIYPNPIVNDYVNELGQRLVPKDSPKTYAFRLLLDPTPRANALTTGTVYVSTGLVSQLDNEAQLAYVLAHEVAHIEKGHKYQQIRNEVIEPILIAENEAQASKKGRILGAIGGIAGGIVGRVIGGKDSAGASLGAALGGAIGYFAGALSARNKLAPTEWSTVNEDEADEAGLRYVLAQNFDVREVPKVYTRLERMVSRDARVGLGFMGSRDRVKERTAQVEKLLNEALKPDIDKLLASGALTGAGPSFAVLMSALRRDNGIAALDYDLFEMAKDNLEGAAKFRSSDPAVHYHLGRVMSLTARTDEDRRGAANHFLTAIRYDADRGSFPEPRLQHALNLIKQSDPANNQEIQTNLKAYVALYQRVHAGALPPNMQVIYDYFQLAGDPAWSVQPFTAVQTKIADWPIVDRPAVAANQPAPKAAPKVVPAAVPPIKNP